MEMLKQRRLAAALIASATALTAAGCGLDSDAENESGLTEVKVGTLAIAAAGPLYLGVEHGIFEKHGLDVTIEPNVAGSAVTAAVVSGQLQFGGYVNPVSVMIAAEKELDVQIVAPGSAAADSGPQGEWDALVVPADSDIDTIADLKGGTIAVNSLNTTETVLMTELMKQAGIDPASVELQELPFPNMEAALLDDQVDAAYLTEPFVTIATPNTKVISFIDQGFGQPMSTGVWIGRADYLEENPETAQAFVDAIAESNEYADAHPEEVREAVTDYAKTDPAIAEQIKLPTWDLDVDPESNGLAMIAGFMQDQGLISAPVDFDSLIFAP